MLSRNGTSGTTESCTDDNLYNDSYNIKRSLHQQLSDMAEVFVDIGDENGNQSSLECLALSSLDCFTAINGNTPVKLKNSYSRKREASTSLSDDPKRKDHLRRSNNNRSDARDMSYTDHELMQSEQTNGDCFHNSYSHTNQSLPSNVQSTKNSDNPILLGRFLNANTLSSDDRSCSSSISDLSVQSNGNSVGIQEHLDCLHLTDEAAALQNDAYRSPLLPSLFHRVPPIIYFSSPQEKVYPLPEEVRKSLKWKLSLITPTCVKQAVERAGFHIIEEDTTDWVGTWGKHMKCVAFKNVREFQKVNHFPGSFHLGRKDKIWVIYSKMLTRHDSQEFSFFPETFVLPQDIRQLRQVWEKEGAQKRWIIKPPASARGTGIKVINRWTQIPKKRPVVVQRYLNNPYLINGSKFDLRLYVLVPCYEPLRVYIFNDGLVRFASATYSTSVLSLNDPFMHLTNYSINRKNSLYTSNDDENTCQGHKWSLKSLWNYLSGNGIDTEKIWDEILDLVTKTVICSEAPMARLIRNHTKSRYNCFELYGFDIMLDRDLKPWLLEVNISPSLHTSSPLDKKIKCQLTKDMFNIAGFRVPEKVLKNISAASLAESYNLSAEEIQDLCMNKNLHQWYLTNDEKTKQSNFTWKTFEDKDILDNLTSDDVRHLVESEDELCRCGSFTRIFPTNSTHKYLKYFEHVRYYNLLFDSWEQKYYNDRSEGISLLQNLCQKNVHLTTVFNETPLTV